MQRAIYSVNHDDMFHLFSERGVPPSLLVLQNWYPKLFVNVRWGACWVSFPVQPGLFNFHLFINLLNAPSVLWLLHYIHVCS